MSWYALNQSGARFLVTANSFKSSDYSAMLFELALNSTAAL